MKRPAIFTAALLAALPLARPAAAGDKILRLGPDFVEPASSPASIDTGEVSSDSLDGWLDGVRRTDGGLDGAPGGGLGLEVKLSERIGIDTRLAYSRYDFRLDVSSDAGWTPWVEERDAGDGGHRGAGPILGEGAGRVTRGLLTVGVSFHPLRRGKLDLYFGPLAGVCYSETELDSGRFLASSGRFIANFGNVASVAPPGRRESDRQTEFVYGAALGLDLPLGEEGWLASTTVRYLETEMEVDPWTVGVGLGYRF